MSQRPATFLSLVGGGWAVLAHQINDKGAFTGVISVGVAGMFVDPDGVVVAYQTGRKLIDARAMPLMGPDGEIETHEGLLFAGVDEYCNYIKDRTQ